jgi:hypothetical protein
MKILVGNGADAVYLPGPSTASLPGQTAASSVALSLRLDRKGEDGFVDISLNHGIPVRRETYRGGRLYAVLVYERGRPQTERVDADGDGRFETERTYDPEGDGSESSILSVRVDTKGSGIFDYREDERFPFRKEWDLDADGRIDAIQYQGTDGATRREFSSRLNGHFDEALTIRNGRIVSLSRDGRTPKLVADANPAVTWIGSKPFDLGSKLPQSEGIYTYMNKRYRLIYVGDRAFAELVP